MIEKVVICTRNRVDAVYALHVTSCPSPGYLQLNYAERAEISFEIAGLDVRILLHRY